MGAKVSNFYIFEVDEINIETGAHLFLCV